MDLGRLGDTYGQVQRALTELFERVAMIHCSSPLRGTSQSTPATPLSQCSPSVAQTTASGEYHLQLVLRRH
jgi:hypothetical protein